ncbi:hypothetical protein GPECTOR_8g32 [Gonium pectorale]|uniref:NOL1/NOP2/Sun domain family member 4 n=1 Tax=Gonium pectorale TaxID=33097 RepID=A0A150GSW5_GONPE|nr:hypothetical protein GPECTOR_8g32 [Gonium pectorale]|eukprot:KXZ52945.1 hypothetical protein GPECTOR_8g32 [Gonium pectorale]
MRSSKQTYARGHRAKSKQQDNRKELEKYYTKVYGTRWPSLQAALLKPTVHAAVVNAFIPDAAAAACADAGLGPLLSLGPLAARCRAAASGPCPPAPLDAASALRAWYWMDLASALPVLLLQPRRGHAVLDMCAAPGGKSVLIAQRLFGPAALAPAPSPVAAPSATAAASAPAASAASAAVESGEGEAPAESGRAAEAGPDSREGRGPRQAQPLTAATQPLTPLTAPLLPLPPGKLVCNEPDRSRLARLNKVLEEYAPPTARANVEVLNHQGHMYWARNQAASFDRVLVDAPCSSDRHVLQQAATAARGSIAAADWSLDSCRRIADEQLQLCLAAIRALRVGGRLVYSTCSLAPLQNDELVERLLRRCGPAAVRVLPPLEILREEAAALAAARAGPATMAGSEAGTGPAGGGKAGGGVEVFGAEATRHGAICLPDRGGWGPIYVAVVEKVGEPAAGGAAALMHLRLDEGSDEEEDEEEDEGGEEGAQQADR